MPREQSKKLIEQHIKAMGDVLTKEHDKEKEYIDKLSCLRCGNKVMPVLNSTNVWSEGKMLPNVLARCVQCGTTYAPYTGIEVEGPTSLDELPD